VDTLYLRTFIETLKTGNLTKASENLFITPSTASRRLKLIEGHFGHTLLDRSGPVLTATEAGRLVADQAVRILALETELKAKLHAMDHAEEVLFCCTHSFGIAHLPQVFADFMLTNPDTAKMKLYFDQPDHIVEGLRENRYNLALFEHCIHCTCFRSDEFTTFALPNDEVVFVSSPDHGIGSEFLTIDEVFRHTLYGQNEGSCASKFLATNLRLMGRSVSEFNNHIVVDDLHMIIKAVLQGNGIACVSRGVVEKHVKAGRLVEHRVDGFVHGRKRTLFVSRSKEMNTMTESLRNCILGYFNHASAGPGEAVPE
jgi:LysR family transcriptional regulator, transcriptional activator of the cysJI operon